MAEFKLVGLCGSLRKASTNLMLLHEVARIFDPESFVVGDIDFPLYNEDIENGPGIPDKVQRLADQIADADAVILSTPEYNKGTSGVMKNALDWISRTEGNCWKDKPVAVVSASPGAQGAARAHSMLRTLLLPFRPRLVAAPEVMAGQIKSQLDENGTLTNDMAIKLVTELTDELRREVRRMAA
ncbi:NADPH-dependent FMN reductase [Thalassococcus sp. BH17M4-6]|uniref:NADPH-dependent FMN reductase n=1 Tax=Thalassococcus sp. BH17M4-6 TaxID=3413148 RepID=UPI003BCA45D8